MTKFSIEGFDRPLLVRNWQYLHVKSFPVVTLYTQRRSNIFQQFNYNAHHTNRCQVIYLVKTQKGHQHKRRRIHFLVRRRHHLHPKRMEWQQCLVIICRQRGGLPVRLTFDCVFRPARLRIRPIRWWPLMFATFCTNTLDWNDMARHTGRCPSLSPLPARVKIDLATAGRSAQLTWVLWISSSSFSKDFWFHV